ncbi:hypothetical protein NEAUS03_1622 [Nematocida ausubeli]|nr:hypothetical protein NEAUS03_1622 [Nematocida ausubeli]
MVDKYLSRIENYHSIQGLKKQSEWEIGRQATSICLAGSTLYSGTRDGDVFVYEGSSYTERFFVAPSRIVSMASTPRGTDKKGVVILHEDGTISHVHERKGHAGKIDGFINGVIHADRSWVVSSTDTGVCVFDYNKQSLQYGCAKKQKMQISSTQAVEIEKKVFAVHPDGNCVLMCDGTARLFDLRSMREEMEISNIKNIKAALFHTSRIEMIVSEERAIKTIDIRNVRMIRKIKTKKTAACLHEYKDGIFFSGIDMFTRGICPVTGKSLFVLEASSRLIASDENLALLSPEKVVTIYGEGIKERAKDDHLSES